MLRYSRSGSTGWNTNATQEGVQISARTIKLVDSQCPPAPPIERSTTGTNAQDSDGLQEEFIRQHLNDQTINFSPKIWPASN